MNKSEFRVKSVDEITDLYVAAWFPSDENIKGVIQIAHGITEHVGRYEKFAEYFTNKGYVVVANDIIGHGKSVSDKKNKMYFGPENSWFWVVKDFYNVYQMFSEKYENKPYIVLGFSLGSFVVRSFFSMYPEAKVTDAILVGTGYTSNFSLKIGKFVAKSEAKKVGEDNSTEMINKLALENYNKSFKPVRTKCDWLCANKVTLDEYLNDPIVGKDVSCGLFRELLNGMMYANKLSNIEKIRKMLPILMISGKNDPVGDFCKGIKKLEQTYRVHGIQKTLTKFVDNARHDVFHEENSEDVFEYIFRWIKSNHKFDEKK